MAQIADLLKEIRSAGITIQIDHDSRGVSPGGTMSLDLVRDHRCFATLSIKSIHEANASFNDVDNYRITHLTIDNAEPINLRTPKTGQQIWTEVYALISDRHRRATALHFPHQSHGNGRRHRRRRWTQHNHRQINYSPAPAVSSTEPQPLARPNQADKFYQGHNSRRYKEKFRRFPDHYYRAAQ